MGTIRRCGIAGDWHGDTAWAVSALEQFYASDITEILHLGDFGFGFNESYLASVQDSLARYNQTIRVTLGNHEDYVMVNHFVEHPTIEGFVYDVNHPNILVATRGARWEWSDVSFVSLGGAASIDYKSLTPGIDWWDEERITLGDVFRTVAQGHADIMVTHECPAGLSIIDSHREDFDRWPAEALQYAHQSREMMRQAVDGVKPDTLFHGHYHRYLDTDVTLNDGCDDYTYRNISMDKNGQANNIAVLDLLTREVTMLTIPGEK